MLSRRHLTLLGLLCLSLGEGFGQPNKISWTNHGNAFGVSNSWQDSTGNATLPSSANVAAFDNTVSAQPVVSSSSSVDGVQITDAAGNVTVTGNATLTVGASGIDNQSSTNTQVIAAPLEFDGNSSVINNAGDLTISSDVVNNTTNGLELTGTGGNGNIAGKIGGNGALKKSGTGTWKLSGANVYTGATEVLDGSLQVNASGALPSGGNVIIDEQSAGGSATLDLADTTQTVGPLTLKGASNSTNVVDLGPTGKLVLTGDVHYDATNQPNGGRIWDGVAIDIGAAQRKFTVDHSTNAGGGDLSVETPITGSGGVTKDGSGTLVLSADNTYTGDTLVANGTLQIGNGGSHGGVAGNIANNAAVVFDRSDAANYAGIISGTGNVVQTGAGALTLTGANTFTGTTTVTNGTLAISSDGNLGAAPATSTPDDLTLDAGTLETTANVTLATNRGVSLTTGGGTIQTDGATKLNYAGAIAGAGALKKTGTGTLELSGSNGYSGGTFIESGNVTDDVAGALPNGGNVFLSGGNLNVGHNETIGALGDWAGTGGGNVSIATGATLALTGGSIFSGGIHGAGALKVTNGASETIAGAADHTGGTAIDAGATLQVGDGAANGSLTGDITNNGTVRFNRQDSQTYAGSISGSGLLEIGSAGGNVTLTGQNSYTGDTQIDAGTLVVAAANALPVSTRVSGAGGVAFAGASGTQFSRNGTSTYTGGTHVEGGTLVVGSPTALGTGQVTVDSAAALLVDNSARADVTLANTIGLASGADIGGGNSNHGLAFSGPVSVATNAATVHLDHSVQFAGGLKAASGTTSLTFDTSTGGHFGTALLLGPVDPSVTAITASNAGIVFGAQAAVPASGLTVTASNGYVGIEAMANSSYATPTAASVLRLIGNKAAFAGTLGFDTDRQVAAPHAFNDAVDLSGFGAGTTLGSSSSAVLTGTITPGANGYAFGNGGGVLFVQSPLTSGNVTIASSSGIPGNSLIAVLEGNNSFTGGLSVANSVAVLDSASALPHGNHVSLGDNGYLGYTEAFTGATTFGNFVSQQIAAGSYTATSVIGLDSHAYAASALASGTPAGSRSVADRLDLSGLNSVYLGTASQVVLEGTILAPNRGGANKTLSLLAAKDGVLTIDSSLTPNNVSSVVVGSGAAFATGTVSLQVGSTYTGGTTLKSGTLLLGQSSQKSGGVVVAGPIGTGALTVSPAGQKEPVLAASGPVVLDNSIALGGALQLGAPSGSVSTSSSTTTSSSPYSLGNLVMDGVISDVSGKLGSLDIATSVELNGANTFTGGVTLHGGDLILGNAQALGNRGTLTIATDSGYTQLLSFNDGGYLTNPVVISGPDQYVSFVGNFTLNNALTLNSPLSVSVNPAAPLVLNGVITGPAPLTADWGRVLVTPSATNTSTGGMVATGGTIVLGSANALPAAPTANALRALSYGYIGIGFVPANLQTDFVDRFDKANTTGALGFDSAGTTNTFSGSIDLTGFNGSARLGSATSAKLTGTITPQGSDYNFGNGGGTLEVASALIDAPGVSSFVPRLVYVDSNPDAPLTLRLTGANTYTGGTTVSDSGVIFGAGALPASGSISGSYAYVGTEDPALVAAPGGFVSRFSAAGTHVILGFDSATGTPANVAANISLAGFTDPNTFIGTATDAVITGNITLPTGDTTYHFAGYKGGQLTVGTTLGGLSGVVIGDGTNLATFDNPARGGSALSRVTLTGVNTYSGSTTLNAGELFVGNNSALGTGPLLTGNTVALDGRDPGLSATTSGIVLANAIALGSAPLDVGSGGASFELSGRIAGDTSTALHKIDAGTLTLSGDNTNFAGNVVVEGGGVIFAPARSGSSAGNTSLVFDSSLPASATFEDNATINGIADDSGTGTINLTAAKTLTVNQTFDADFNGTIAGSTAGLTFQGTGAELRLAGNNSYSGPTAIANGVNVTVASPTAFGGSTNPVSLNGGKLVVEQGITVSNPLSVTAGALGGAGTFASPTAITVGNSTVLAPGLKDAIATLHFANALTFADGGTLQLRMLDATASAGGWDQVQVGGNLAITATAAHPFNFQIAPFTAGGLLKGLPMNFDPSTAASWLVVSANAITGFDPAQSQFTIDSSALNGVLAGGTFSLGLNSTGNGLMLNFTPVPEPSTYALMIAGLGTLLIVSRRRRRRA